MSFVLTLYLVALVVVLPLIAVLVGDNPFTYIWLSIKASVAGCIAVLLLALLAGSILKAATGAESLPEGWEFINSIFEWLDGTIRPVIQSWIN
jgi:hypothetical protein